ncbi:DUF1552 domain-containing protein [Lignipirellula cremea]|uniref:DUF1552 domain-containing protein n=1 Tax=Lignipirellula cremea TaxID=2528010 RepID=A0A518DZY2_9BACT|nr:DUF1552 domain-containing protein [Lignipirellula cremea]QDU97393.1 hypothetical protein Pla8534_52390 [Lignipirellula cremea]
MGTKSWQITRREMLRGSGVALALPLLNGMRWAKAAEGAEPPKRMVVSYISYGVYEPQGDKGSHHDWSWWPCKDPGPLTFNKTTAPFEPLRDYVSYLRGLDHAGGYALGGHSSCDVFATGANMAGDETSNNISVDQLAAKRNGHKTRYPSLVMGSEGGTGSYGQSRTLSHYGPGRPIPALHRPQDIFNRLFQPYAGKSVNQVRAGLKREASVLDLMRENSRSLHGRLGREDQRKLDEYLDSIRALEQRVERTSEWTHQPLPQVDAKGLNLEASYQDPVEYLRCMYDLLYLALRTDSTRYASFMLESEFSTSNEVGKFATRVLGYSGQTHDIAHKRPAESGLWDNWRAQQHAYFLDRLRNTPEGDGNMLDQTVVLWGSAHPHQSHSTKNYPLQIAGGNTLGFRHGALHAFEGDKKVPLANLFVSMLNAVDAPTERFADSTGPLTEVLG